MGKLVSLCGLLAIAVALAGCTEESPFGCTSSEQCIRDSVEGTCEPSGACSLPDDACPSGRRFEANAGGECVDESICGAAGEPCCDGACDEGAECTEDMCVTVPSCGGVDQPCCAQDECVTNAFCESGTCQQCVTDVDHGRRHGCAVRFDGSAWCWGDNAFGQLGDGTLTSTPAPAQVSLALGGDPLADVTQVSAGKEHSCALRADGTVWCWGRGSSGRLGNGANVNSPVPVQVVAASATTPLPPLTGIVEVDTGDCYSCARSQDRRVFCWGCGGAGRLGDGLSASRSSAAPVLTEPGGAELGGAVQLDADAQTCVRRGDDGIWCWGLNSGGEVGNGTNVSSPIAVPVFSGVDVAVGRQTTCAAKIDGSVSCWGRSWRGRAGAGSTSPLQLLDANEDPVSGIAALAVGAVSCGITEDKQASCWGTSNYGQTGNGAGGPLPAPVLDPTGDGLLENVERLDAGHAHVCAFLGDGSLYCWGRNLQGDLGDGTTINRGVPTPLALQCQ